MLAVANAGIQDATTINDYLYNENYLSNEEHVPVTKYTTTPAFNHVEENKPANYEYEYSVNDPHTGDIKHHKEVRNGHQVRGSYSLIEADGSKRIVDYIADAHTGFNAIVRREPLAHPATTVSQKIAHYIPNLDNVINEEQHKYYHD